jgi:hypothetical protein
MSLLWPSCDDHRPSFGFKVSPKARRRERSKTLLHKRTGPIKRCPPPSGQPTVCLTAVTTTEVSRFCSRLQLKNGGVEIGLRRVPNGSGGRTGPPALAALVSPTIALCAFCALGDPWGCLGLVGLNAREASSFASTQIDLVSWKQLQRVRHVLQRRGAIRSPLSLRRMARDRI